MHLAAPIGPECERPAAGDLRIIGVGVHGQRHPRHFIEEIHRPNVQLPGLPRWDQAGAPRRVRRALEPAGQEHIGRGGNRSFPASSRASGSGPVGKARSPAERLAFGDLLIATERRSHSPRRARRAWRALALQWTARRLRVVWLVASLVAALVTFAPRVASAAQAAPQTSQAGSSEPAQSPPASDGNGDGPLLLQIARLTDQVQTVEERLAVESVRGAVDALQLDQAEQAMRAAAVEAYVSGGRTPSLTFFVPSPVGSFYTDMVVHRQQDLISALRRAQIQNSRDELSDQSDYKMLRSLQAQLDQERAALEAKASFDAALQIQQQDAQARAEAIQAQQEAEQRAIEAAALNGEPFPAGNALASTQSQQALMSRYPFGPATAAQLAASGLVQSGQTVSGVASWYGPGFDGRPTASGAIYDENGWTCASPDLPFGTLLWVTAGSTGVLVEVNDRGPYVPGRVLDLSHAAAQALGSTGLINVVAYVMVPG